MTNLHYTNKNKNQVHLPNLIVALRGVRNMDGRLQTE